MTPAEVIAIKACADAFAAESGKKLGSMNERLHVDRLLRRVTAAEASGQVDQVGMTDPERSYLGKISGKLGLALDLKRPAEGEAGSAARADAGDHGAQVPVVTGKNAPPGVELHWYDTACKALAQAASHDEVLEIVNQGAGVQAYARQANNFDLVADAWTVQRRAERRLGALIPEAQKRGEIRAPSQRERSGSEREPLPPTLEELGISKKLSARAQALARIDDDMFEASLSEICEEIRVGKRLPARDVLKRAGQAGEFQGARATMANRREAPDSLDFFPTPPWATRALIEEVLPYAGETVETVKRRTAYDPACGEGHITGVCQEYFGDVSGSDIHDYGFDDRWAPGWRGTFDYLERDKPAPAGRVDWIITNPPFKEKALGFTLRAIADSDCGAAVFCQLRWLEGETRFNELWLPNPPTVVAIFIDRVECCKGRWNPDGGSATAYCWLIWRHGAERKPPMWIPPGAKQQLTRDDDVERFTTQPVIGFARLSQGAMQ